MTKQSKVGSLIVGAVIVVALGARWLSQAHIAVLDPRGQVASDQRDLIVSACLLSLFVVIPVFVLTFSIAWKYREGNHKAKYSPDWDHHRLLEAVWWLIPAVLILIISVMDWRSSHSLDPFKPLAAKTQPVTIQVVALDWKWLFIYPKENIATINEVRFPAGTPVNFQITADAPMNSFWIPQLGGQIYAMTGMSTELHLIADHPGAFRGSSANISGKGFAGMQFTARATSPGDYNKWIQSVKRSGSFLSQTAYNRLAEPSQNMPVAYYSSKESNLYNKVIAKYMGPVTGSQETQIR